MISTNYRVSQAQQPSFSAVGVHPSLIGSELGRVITGGCVAHELKTASSQTDVAGLDVLVGIGKNKRFFLLGTSKTDPNATPRVIPFDEQHTYQGKNDDHNGKLDYFIDFSKCLAAKIHENFLG